MFESIHRLLFTNWHTMRWVALGVGLALGYNWLINSATLSGFLSIFFLYQAVTNTGCMAGRCAVPSVNSPESEMNEVQYEEIKPNKQ
jgi:hypothetical protein